jgi:hypothetical protein
MGNQGLVSSSTWRKEELEIMEKMLPWRMLP